MRDYESPFMVNPMCMDNGTLAWYFTREEFVKSGSQEAYESMLGYVTLEAPLMEWE